MVYFSPTVVTSGTADKAWDCAGSGISGADTSPWARHASTAACEDEIVIIIGFCTTLRLVFLAGSNFSDFSGRGPNR